MKSRVFYTDGKLGNLQQRDIRQRVLKLNTKQRKALCQILSVANLQEAIQHVDFENAITIIEG